MTARAFAQTTEPVQTARGNRLLDRLPPEERRAVLERADHVALTMGQEVVIQGSPVGVVHFPLGGVLSVVVTTEDGRRIEAATVGREGAVGAAAYLSDASASFTSLVQVPDFTLRVPLAALRTLGARFTRIDRTLRRWAAYAIRYSHQTVACSALHRVEQRFARWLLMAQDRLGASLFPLTHEALADALGVRRQTVTVAAGALKRTGAIVLARGSMRILDRGRLEAASCECYAVIRAMYAQQGL